MIFTYGSLPSPRSDGKKRCYCAIKAPRVLLNLSFTDITDYSSRPRAPRQAAPEYDEYEGADDFESGPPRRSTPNSASSQSRPSSSRPQPPPKSRAPPKAEAVVEQPKEKVKEVDLFDFADDEPVAPAGGSSAAPILGGDGECLLLIVVRCENSIATL